ncbi:15-cis-phytoene synthase [Cereibacter sediminicola]|uniref:15-cis-phytoene synthase n=1 Tax=Cereibacter sediminicola TaxID=2584941 RepID=UPI0011A73286|nr:phytoene/squalene synthase family protein [Cereibacter sediminicola]
MIAPADLEACRELIRTGSYSFHAASRLLPEKVRAPSLALYAFCRVADDAVDEAVNEGQQEDAEAKRRAVLSLRDRLDLVYAGRPRNAPADRAFAAVVEEFEMPRTLPEALLEGLAWDAVGKSYDTFSGVLDYSARVAAAVGAMMCVLMRVRDPDVLARACDLGLAMQLTNIARDVGTDARSGRIYLPRDWMEEAGLPVEEFLANPVACDRIRAVTRRLLRAADRLYYRSESGVCGLPLACRPGIYAARHIYAAIGREVARNGYDSVTRRAFTNKRQKLVWLAVSATRAALTPIGPGCATLHAAPEPEVAFLVNAAARAKPQRGRSEALIAVLAQLEAQDRQIARQRMGNRVNPI